jgi:Ca2+-binding EF-hand superfamily protein
MGIVTEKELQKLYKNFNKIDKDKNGTLSPEEFFDIPGMFKFSDKLANFRTGTESTSQESDCCTW